GDGAGAVVLEILDQRAGFGAFVKDLRLALVDLLAPCHELSAAMVDGGGGATPLPALAYSPSPRQPQGGKAAGVFALAARPGSGHMAANQPNTGDRHDHLRRPRECLRGQVRP